MDAISEIQSGDINNVDPAKEKAFADLGLDEHQWDVFELVWDYCHKKPEQEYNDNDSDEVRNLMSIGR